MNVESQQLDALNRLLSLNTNNAFVTQRLEASGLTLPLKNLTEFSAFPFTTKTELVADQQQHPPYGSNLAFPPEGYARYHQTSGTTGSPLRWLDTNESWSWMVDNWVTVFQKAGVSALDRIVFAFSFGPFLGFWTAFDAGVRMGALCLPGGGMNSEARLRLIRANQATVLCCTPTYALRLGQQAAEGDGLVASVHTILVAGEPGGGIPATRARIEALWPNAMVIDHHGMTEVGPVSVTPRNDRGVLHLLEKAYYAEIIEPETGEPVKPGETGELVLTTLGRTGSPALRYRTGDLVRRNADVDLALSNYRLPGGILGRIDDMLVVRGVNLYPGAVEALIRPFAEIAEFQVEIFEERDMTEVRIRVEPVPECTDPQTLAENVALALQGELALRVPVEAVEGGSLPRFEMKAKRWIRR